MTSIELFQSGKLQEAVRALGEEVRNHPQDAKRRTFLFELLCFAGEYDRAAKHLDILADTNPAAKVGAIVYRSAIQTERVRQKMFADRTYPPARANTRPAGIRNGAFFTGFSDADSRIGRSLEVFVAGSYTWIALDQIASIVVPPPQRLRDLLWTPAIVTPKAAYRAMGLGEVFLPVLAPSSWNHSDDLVRLGRCTVWENGPGSDYVPFGQKMFLIDDQEVPILELGRVEFSALTGEARVASA